MGERQVESISFEMQSNLWIHTVASSSNNKSKHARFNSDIPLNRKKNNKKPYIFSSHMGLVTRYNKGFDSEMTQETEASKGTRENEKY